MHFHKISEGRVKSLYDAGILQKDIAAILGCTPARVCQILRDLREQPPPIKSEVGKEMERELNPLTQEAVKEPEPRPIELPGPTPVMHSTQTKPKRPPSLEGLSYGEILVLELDERLTGPERYWLQSKKKIPY